MKSNIFIPKQINVGFQNRSDTYTKKLAYVIYFDNKGVLRKESSWNSWRDNKIDNIIYDNVPTEGFVLNKKVGDYSSGWDHRQAYVRIYDPRDFEFEITIENLLYILENTSAIKGKGLEGEFVYGWDGKDLILIPVSSPDYQELKEFTDLVYENKKFKAKDLIVGATYKDKSLTEWIYMGRFDKWDIEYEKVYKNNNSYSYSRNYDTIRKDVNKGKYHFFVKENDDYINILTLKSIGDKFIDIVSSECVENYADLFDKLERRTDYSPYDESKDKYILYKLEDLKNCFKEHRYIYCYYNLNGQYKEIEIESEKIWSNNYDPDYNDFSIENRQNWDYLDKHVSLEYIFNKYKPYYKNEYLANGKLYRGKGEDINE